MTGCWHLWIMVSFLHLIEKRTVFVCGFFFGTGYSISRDVAEDDSLVWVISGSELHLMKRCASKEGELRLRVQEKYTGWNNQDNLWLPSLILRIKKSICLIDEKGRIILLDATNLNSFRVIDLGRTGSLSVNSVLYDDGRIWISTIAHGGYLLQ